MAMGDVNGQFTSVLARAGMLLKDNRIPPEGFTTTSPVYDTVKVSADALADADFNKLNGVEGTGSDFVQFKVPVAGLLGNIKVNARLYYQSVPPKWLDEMFTYNSSHIDTFRNMYNAADKTPVLVAADSTTDVLTALASYSEKSIKVGPTISHDGIISVEVPNQDQIIRMEAFDASGKKYFLKKINQAGNRTQFQLPEATGVFIIRVTTRLGSKSVRVMRL